MKEDLVSTIDIRGHYIIAATAWSKKMPLLTRNKRHFSRIQEITLGPEYEKE